MPNGNIIRMPSLSTSFMMGAATSVVVSHIDATMTAIGEKTGMLLDTMAQVAAWIV